MWWLHPSLHLTRTGVWSYCLQVRPVGWARLSLHRGQARAWLPEPTKAVTFWLCCFIHVQSWSQVVKKYVNSQRNYWDMWDRCLKACTYFSLPSQFAGTTVTIAFLLLALLLLPSAYGWGKLREIEDLKKKFQKETTPSTNKEKSAPCFWSLMKGKDVISVWKRSDCISGLCPEKQVSWMIFRALCATFFTPGTYKAGTRRRKWIYNVKWSQPRGLLGIFFHFGCHRKWQQ